MPAPPGVTCDRTASILAICVICHLQPASFRGTCRNASFCRPVPASGGGTSERFPCVWSPALRTGDLFLRLLCVDCLIPRTTMGYLLSLPMTFPAGALLLPAEAFAFPGNNGLICNRMRVSATYPVTWTLPEFLQGGGITHYYSADYILRRWRSTTAGCLSAVRPCNSPADEVRATSTSSGHRVRRCGHFGLTCRRTPTHNALCGTLTPQVIFTKPESSAVTVLPPSAPVIRVCSSDGLQSLASVCPLIGLRFAHPPTALRLWAPPAIKRGC